METRGSTLQSLTERIGQQVNLLQLDECVLFDSNTLRARFEAIQQFATQGLVYLEEYEDRPDQVLP